MKKLIYTFVVLMLITATQQLHAQTREVAHRHFDVLSSIGISFGQTLRVTFVNTAETNPVVICPCVHDPDGAVVKESCMTLQPGQTRWLDLSRSELFRSDGNRVQLRTGVLLPRATDVRNLQPAGEVFDEVSGKTSSSFAAVAGWGTNHNETLVIDDGQ